MIYKWRGKRGPDSRCGYRVRWIKDRLGWSALLIDSRGRSRNAINFGRRTLKITAAQRRRAELKLMSPHCRRIGG